METEEEIEKTVLEVMELLGKNVFSKYSGIKPFRLIGFFESLF